MAAGITGLIGGFFGSDKELYGSKPVVPGAPDYNKALKNAIKGNIDLLPELETLGTKSTALNKKLREQALPGIGAIEESSLENIKSWLSGDLSDKEVSQIKRYVGAQAYASGLSPSMQAGREAEVFGQSSYARQMQGVQAAERWSNLSQNRSFDFSKMFFGPADAIAQADATWNRDWLSAQVEASPDPAVRGAYDSEMALIGMVLSAYGGGAGYTGQYHANYGGGAGGGGGGGGGYNNGGASYFGSGGPGSPEYDVNVMTPMSEYDSGGKFGGLLGGGGGGGF